MAKVLAKVLRLLSKFIEMGTGIWCNGNTTDFGSVFSGSNPDIPTKCRSVVMVAKPDSKSGAREGVWVRVPPSVRNMRV